MSDENEVKLAKTTLWGKAIKWVLIAVVIIFIILHSSGSYCTKLPGQSDKDWSCIRWGGDPTPSEPYNSINQPQNP